MAPIGKIYSYPNNVRVAKSLIAAKYAGVEVDVEACQIGKDTREPSFLKKWPLGKLPVFESAKGEYLFESDAIATYIAAHKADELLGATPIERATIQQFMAFATNEISTPATGWLYPIHGWAAYNHDVTEKAKADIKRSLTALNAILATRTFLAAEHVTYADIAVACSLKNLYVMVFDPAFREPFGNVTRYFLTLVNQPNFLAVLGEVTLCVKAAEPKKEEPKKEEPKKEEKKAEAPKKEEKKEEPKKEEKKKAKKEEDDEEEEEDYEDKPAGKNPLDLLPPSTFNLEAWKRFYSNNPEAAAIKYFWDNFDANGFSIWTANYKYNEENKAIYMTCNLLNGTFQRWERARKYAFGSFCIFGEDNDNEIKGVWVFRGADIPAEVREADDFESYSFEKLDVNDAKLKERFNAFLAWDEIPGTAAWHGVSTKKFNQGKVFK